MRRARTTVDSVPDWVLRVALVLSVLLTLGAIVWSTYLEVPCG
jgi:hypothetical protein